MVLTKEELFTLTLANYDRESFAQAKGHWDALSKPIDGLGDFEDLVCRLAAIQGKEIPQIAQKRVLICCGDHGVVAEGVSQSGQEVTRSVAESIGKGKSTVCILAQGAGAQVLGIDFGICGRQAIPGIVDCKVAEGSRNFRWEPAMTEAECLRAISFGMELVRQRQEAGDQILATGEMGIGNTSSATALAASLLSVDSEEITGRGAGLSEEGLRRKRQVIREALQQYKGQEPEGERARSLFLLETFGGYEIAGMVGIFLGAAVYGMPVIIDGLISGVASLVAEKFLPGAKSFFLPSHAGREKGTALILQELDLKPLLLGNMALGEGTGAVLLFPLLDTVLYYYRHGIPFAQTPIEAYERFTK